MVKEMPMDSILFCVQETVESIFGVSINIFVFLGQNGQKVWVAPYETTYLLTYSHG